MGSVKVPGQAGAPTMTAEELAKSTEEKNAQAETNAKSGVPQPIIENQISDPSSTERATEYVGEDGEQVPVADGNATVHQRSITADDVTDAAGTSLPYGYTQVDGQPVNFATGANGGGYEATFMGRDPKDPVLVHNIPGTPKGHLALTDKGKEAFLKEGFIESEPAGYSNGIPYYKVTDAFEDAVHPERKAAKEQADADAKAADQKSKLDAQGKAEQAKREADAKAQADKAKADAQKAQAAADAADAKKK